ncbi:unnamed protein product [Thelazia callipaeda]|uniref:RRM domain-containing protein n=1 Tax=Thelazia callipaeda TaxID=103827 RepID=A0A0N5CZQ8_THECL|nr:unnamed protein product [Thelazia callipaeda]
MAKIKKVKDVKPRVPVIISQIDPEANSKAIVISHIPFGFFEKELLSYFSQFGKVDRVRVARNKKASFLILISTFCFTGFTGNHKGWAFVLFKDCEVAQLAAEAMNGYLMYEKRLECKVIKNKNFPRCLLKGPRLIPPPVKGARTKQHALKMNKVQSECCEKKSEKRMLRKLRVRKKKLSALGYQLPTVAGLPKEKLMTPTPAKEIDTLRVTEVKSENIKENVMSKPSTQ